ncbi:Nramp family divalent metal transporter [Virgibacillus phasianinus]|uniref:Nramp family divalent metal transporter n=1 Tax=Virgibacillus phasianinus TaxID=2017483 RepID=UPI001FEB9E42|nr:Nramp family divalent metal transporter [Virgibacillus phasianinus]
MEEKIERLEPQGTPNNPPNNLKGKLKFVGPGFVVAATGVGAGDFVMASIAGTSFGLTLLWVIVVGAFIKFVLTEGIGRWYLASGKTILEGWHLAGWWATIYFGAYLVLMGLIYGSAITGTCAMIMVAMFPGTSFSLWAISSGIAGFLLVWFGRYQILEGLMKILIGIMFVSIIGSAIIILANAGSVEYGIVPSIPEGSFFKILGILGGVGASITLTSYSYWIYAKGWRNRQWMSIMKLDVSVAYIVTGMFAISVMIIAAELLFGSGVTISGNDGLVGLADAYGERFGNIARWIFLIGVWGAIFTSIVGPWHGMSYLFTDFVRIVKNKGRKAPGKEKPITEKDTAFRFYLFWITFPPMLLLLFKQPVAIVLIYGALGAAFMPILAAVLLFLLNSKQIDKADRNTKVKNTIFGLIILLYLYLGGSELFEMIFG